MVGPLCVIPLVKAAGQLVAALLAFWFPGGAVAQTGASSDAANSFFQRQGLLLNRPQPSNTMVIPQARAVNRPDPARQEKFDRLTINGVIYTNVLLRTINASEGALHHDGGLEKILWRSAELTHLCSAKLTQRFKAGIGAFSFQVVEGVAV